MKLIPILVAAAALSASAFAQSPTGAQVFPGKEVSALLDALVAKAKASGSSGLALGDYGTHAIKLSVRGSSGGGAEIHAHVDDIFIVVDGSATLVTGGTVLNAKTSTDGETKGRGIEGGVKQTLHKGDVVHIPAGMPHQLFIAPGEIYSCIVIKVKE